MFSFESGDRKAQMTCGVWMVHSGAAGQVYIVGLNHLVLRKLTSLFNCSTCYGIFWRLFEICWTDRCCYYRKVFLDSSPAKVRLSQLHMILRGQFTPLLAQHLTIEIHCQSSLTHIQLVTHFHYMSTLLCLLQCLLDCFRNELSMFVFKAVQGFASYYSSEILTLHKHNWALRFSDQFILEGPSSRQERMRTSYFGCCCPNVKHVTPWWFCLKCCSLLTFLINGNINCEQKKSENQPLLLMLGIIPHCLHLNSLSYYQYTVI